MNFSTVAVFRGRQYYYGSVASNRAMVSKWSKAKSTRLQDIFVGRKAEMDLISRRLDDAKTGQGSFIDISGEPGIGKTRLAQAAAVAAKERDFSVFWGQCHDGQYIPPYWPWKQVLKELVGLLPGSRSSLQNKGILIALSEVVADAGLSHAQASTMPKPITTRARVKILESVTSLLRLVSERGPLLLILDNLHCADVPSLQLLQVAAREMSRTSIVIIGSHRESPAEAGGSLRETIGVLAGQPFFEGIALMGWDQASVAQCLGEFGIVDPPPRLVQAVHARTEGNPLFVVEVARLLQQKGLLDAGSEASAKGWETYIPQKVRLAIRGLFDRLSAASRDALGAASIIGREFESSMLREIMSANGPDVESALEEALSHGFIEETAERAGHYRFMHALVQDVVDEQTTGPRRQALHLKTAEALERRYGNEAPAVHTGALARHFDAAGADHAGKAILYYRLAGERALRMCGYQDAHDQLTRALELCQGSARHPDNARLLFGLAQSEHGLGRLAAASETHARAFDLFVKNGEIGNAVAIFEQPLILMEKPAKLTALIEKGISVVGAGSLRGEALGGKYGLAIYHDTGDYPRAVAIFERALRSARASSDREQEIGALANWGRIECDELRFEKALAMEEEALRLARENGDLWMQALVHATSGIALLGLGRIREAEEQARSLRELAPGLQTGLWIAISSVLSSAVHRQKGDLKAAREITDQALSMGESMYTVWNRASRVLFDFETAQIAQRAELFQQVVAAADGAVLPFHWEGLLALLIPYIAWVTGETLPLEIAEQAARKVPVFGGLRRGDAVTVNVGLSLISAIRHDIVSATRHYQELLPLKGLIICPYLGLAADHVLGILATVSGEPTLALEHFESALGFCRSRGLVLELAYTCRDCAEFLFHTSAKTEAQRIVHLSKEAGQIAEHSGLVHLTERLEKLHSAVTHGKPHRREYPDSLSEREVDVLRLLSEGLTNAQIGERLFISLHTVANHVQSILEKTGVANRTEAAMYAIRNHLSDESPPAGS